MSLGGAASLAKFWTTKFGWKLLTKKAIQNPKTMLYPIEFSLTKEQAELYRDFGE